MKKLYMSPVNWTELWKKTVGKSMVSLDDANTYIQNYLKSNRHSEQQNADFVGFIHSLQDGKSSLKIAFTDTRDPTDGTRKEGKIYLKDGHVRLEVQKENGFTYSVNLNDPRIDYISDIKLEIRLNPPVITKINSHPATPNNTSEPTHNPIHPLDTNREESLNRIRQRREARQAHEQSHDYPSRDR